MFNRFRPSSLKLRLLVLVSGLIVMGIVGLAWRVSAALQDDLAELLAGQLAATVGYVAADVEHEIQLRITAIKEIAATITPEILGDPAKAQRFLEQSKVSRVLYPVGLAIANKEGIIIADDPPLDERRGISLKDFGYFREIMAGSKQALGSPVLGRFSKQPMVAISVPIFDAFGAPAGVLVSAVLPSDPSLFGQIEKAKIGKTGYFIVASPKDKLIVSATNKSRIMTPMPARGVNPLLDRRLDDGFEGAGITINTEGAEVLTVSRNMKSTGWIVFAGITTGEAFAPIVKIKQQIYLAALLLSLTVLAILGFVLKKQLAPLDEAAHAMEQMSAGEEPLSPLPVRREDEIGRLVKNFNGLVAERNRLDQELRGEISERKRKENEVKTLNENLEQRIERRTKELLAVNLQLVDEIRYRQVAESTASDFSARLQVMTRRHADAHESERRRLARELHDRVSSNLMAIGLNLDLMEKQLPREAAASVGGRLSDTADLVKETMFVCRDISADLHPAILDYEGVFGALEEYVHKFRARTGIAVAITGNGRETKLAAEKEIALYRIAQEALTNCAKHAAARNVTIAFNGGPDHVELVITDDGDGFDPGDLKRRGRDSGLGMLSMRERADAVGGKFRMESAPGSGTRIIVVV